MVTAALAGNQTPKKTFRTSFDVGWLDVWRKFIEVLAFKQYYQGMKIKLPYWYTTLFINLWNGNFCNWVYFSVNMNIINGTF